MFEDEDLACVSTRRYRRASVCQLRVAVCVVFVCVCARAYVGGQAKGCESESVFPGFQRYLGFLSHPLQLRGSPGVGKQHVSEIQVERSQP